MEACRSFRVARGCSSIDSILKFYRDGLGMNILGSFKGHAGYDGVMLGHSSLSYHLEFTVDHNHPNESVRAPNRESILVFYFHTEEQCIAIVDRMTSHGFNAVKPANPFWEGKSTCYEDCDGYHVIITSFSWED